MMMMRRNAREVRRAAGPPREGQSPLPDCQRPGLCCPHHHELPLGEQPGGGLCAGLPGRRHRHCRVGKHGGRRRGRGGRLAARAASLGASAGARAACFRSRGLLAALPRWRPCGGAGCRLGVRLWGLLLLRYPLLRLAAAGCRQLCRFSRLQRAAGLARRRTGWARAAGRAAPAGLAGQPLQLALPRLPLLLAEAQLAQLQVCMAQRLQPRPQHALSLFVQVAGAVDCGRGATRGTGSVLVLFGAEGLSTRRCSTRRKLLLVQARRASTACCCATQRLTPSCLTPRRAALPSYTVWRMAEILTCALHAGAHVFKHHQLCSAVHPAVPEGHHQLLSGLQAEGRGGRRREAADAGQAQLAPARRQLRLALALTRIANNSSHPTSAPWGSHQGTPDSRCKAPSVRQVPGATPCQGISHSQLCIHRTPLDASHPLSTRLQSRDGRPRLAAAAASAAAAAALAAAAGWRAVGLLLLVCTHECLHLALGDLVLHRSPTSCGTPCSTTRRLETEGSAL